MSNQDKWLDAAWLILNDSDAEDHLDLISASTGVPLHLLQDVFESLGTPKSFLMNTDATAFIAGEKSNARALPRFF